jgi:hypothetical protein
MYTRLNKGRPPSPKGYRAKINMYKYTCILRGLAVWNGDVGYSYSVRALLSINRWMLATNSSTFWAP